MSSPELELPELESLDVGKKVRRVEAERYLSSLFRNFSQFGLYLGEAKYVTTNMPPPVTKIRGPDGNVLLEVEVSGGMDVKRSKAVAVASYLSGFYGSGDIVLESGTIRVRKNCAVYEINNVPFGESNYRMSLVWSPRADNPYKLDLATDCYQAPSQITIESVQPYFNFWAVQYDFRKHQAARDFLFKFTKKRIPSEMVTTGDLPKSSIQAFVQEDGMFDTRIMLHLQDTDPKNYCKCFEVEVVVGGKKNSPETTELAPESIWQEDENHYCMSGTDGYPLITTELLKRTAKLTLVISGERVLRDNVYGLIGDLPLSLDGQNQWFARREFGDHSLSWVFNPRYQEKPSLVYTKSSEKRINARQILDVMKQLEKIKSVT